MNTKRLLHNFLLVILLSVTTSPVLADDWMLDGFAQVMSNKVDTIIVQVDFGTGNQLLDFWVTVGDIVICRGEPSCSKTLSGLPAGSYEVIAHGTIRTGDDRILSGSLTIGTFNLSGKSPSSTPSSPSDPAPSSEPEITPTPTSKPPTQKPKPKPTQTPLPKPTPAEPERNAHLDDNNQQKSVEKQTLSECLLALPKHLHQECYDAMMNFVADTVFTHERSMGLIDYSAPVVWISKNQLR